MEKTCVFCDRAQLSDRLVGEDKNFLVVATFGQISDGGYLVLIPKPHVSCVGAMQLQTVEKLEKMSDKICSAIATEYGVAPIIFEHGIVGQTVKHAHLHFVPESCDITERVRRDFSDREISVVSSFGELARLYASRSRQQPYLFWRDSSEIARACWNPPAPPQYLRIVVAETVGRPERASWKDMDPVLDRRLGQETVTRLKRYF